MAAMRKSACPNPLAGYILAALVAARGFDAAPGRMAALATGFKLGVARKLTLDLHCFTANLKAGLLLTGWG